VPDAQGLSEWQANAARPGAAVRHPVLFQDNLDDGYRLASLIDVDVASSDRHQLARLMLAALGHVQARLLRGAGGQAARPARKWTVAARTPAAS
jgi:hypothetical protein